jgi:hypothetical protein
MQRTEKVMNKEKALELALKALEEAYEIVGAAWTWRNEKGRPAITAIKQALAAPVQEPSPFGILFAVEQAIENGDCPMEIEIQFDAYEAERRGKNNGFA